MMELNKTRLLSGFLALTCLFGLVACWGTVGDFMNAKDHWEKVHAEGEESFGRMADGIEQLRANEEKYVSGVYDYEAGLREYEEGLKTVEQGEKDLAAGQKEYDEGLITLTAGHKQYDDGVLELEAGKETLAQGKQDLAAGIAALNAGYDQYYAGLDEYENGLIQYEEGLNTYNLGKAELEANRDAYNEGKLKLFLVSPLYYLFSGIVDYMDEEQEEYDSIGDVPRYSPEGMYKSYLDFDLSNLKRLRSFELDLGDGTAYSMDSIITEYEDGQEQIKYFEDSEKLLKDGEVELKAAEIQLAEGKDQLRLAEGELAAGEAAVADGEAQVAQGERDVELGEATLKSAKAELDAGDAKIALAADQLKQGKADLEAGKEKLKQGEKELADGRRQLTQYEDGERELAEGLDTAMANETYYNAAGKPLIKSIADRLGGDSFTYWKKNADGSVRELNGTPYLDLSKADRVLNAGLAFMSDCNDAVTAELTTRILSAIICTLTALLGIVSALMLFFGKHRQGFILGLITAVIAFIGFAYTFFNGGVELPFSTIAEAKTSLPVHVALVLISLAAALCAVTAFLKNHSAYDTQTV